MHIKVYSDIYLVNDKSDNIIKRNFIYFFTKFNIN